MRNLIVMACDVVIIVGMAHNLRVALRIGDAGMVLLSVAGLALFTAALLGLCYTTWFKRSRQA